MNPFDFGTFQQIYDYLVSKLNAGDALTPQEQAIYDSLVSFAGQGLNLTNTGDFQSLYTAFNALADTATKKQFEQLYGTNFTTGPNGQISFTQPGSVIEAFQKRGLSVNDGPVMAALSQGLQNYLSQIAQNKFASITNAYSAMTPIRGQNMQALTNAGGIASTAIGRRVPIAGAAVSGGAASGADSSAGGSFPLPPTPATPSIWEKLLLALAGPAATGLLGIGGMTLKDYLQGNKADKQSFTQQELDTAASNIVAQARQPYNDYLAGLPSSYTPYSDPSLSSSGMYSSTGGLNQNYSVDPSLYTNPSQSAFPSAAPGGQSSWQQNYSYDPSMYMQQPSSPSWQQSSYNQPYNPNSAFGSSWQQNYSYDPWASSSFYDPSASNSYYDPKASSSSSYYDPSTYFDPTSFYDPTAGSTYGWY